MLRADLLRRTRRVRVSAAVSLLPEPPQPPLAEMAAPLRAFIARRVARDHVDDVLQDALLKVHERGDQLRDAGRFSAWVYRIGRNAVADHHRALQRGGETPVADLDPVQAGEPVDGAEQAFREALGAGIALGIELLPPEYAEALRLVELQGMSQADAARALGLPPSSLRTRVQRGRKLLRDQLQRACELHFDARDRLVDCTPRGDCCGASPAEATDRPGPRR